MKKLFLSIILFSTLTFSQDAIEVSPSTLDFGNVLMGNTPSLTFSINCNLDQTITITPPSFYSVDITEIAMTDGQTQQVVVTFNPPQVGNFDSQITLAGSTFGTAAVMVNATVVNDLSGSVSGTLSSEFSPYEVSDDLIVEEGNTWTIEAGTELKFAFGKRLIINGDLNVQGHFDNKVKMTAMFPDSGWAGIFFEDANESSLEYIEIEQVTNNLENEPEYIAFEDFEDGINNIGEWQSIDFDEVLLTQKVASLTLGNNSNGSEILNIDQSIHQNQTLIISMTFRVELIDDNGSGRAYFLIKTNSNSNTIIDLYSPQILSSENEFRTVHYSFTPENNTTSAVRIIPYDPSNNNNVRVHFNEVGVRRYGNFGSIGGVVDFESEYTKFPGSHVVDSDEDFSTKHMKFVGNDDISTYFYTPNFSVIQDVDKNVSFDLKISENHGGGKFTIYASDEDESTKLLETNGGSNIPKTNYNIPIDLDGSQIRFFFFTTPNYLEDDFYIYMDDFKVTGSDAPGAINIYNSQEFSINNSLIKNSIGGIKLNNSNAIIKNVNVLNNNYAGITLVQSSGAILNSIIWSNFVDILSLSSNISVDYSIVSSIIGTVNYGENIINQYPLLDLESLIPLPLSPAIDAAHPSDFDNCMPPGEGSLAADIGMYGGMNNCGAQATNLGGGEPSITVVEDMPQDQGGYVGIQFSGSHYDGNSNVYDVTHYSVWRELDTDGSSSIEAQSTPDGRYFRLNTRNTNAWEYIGDTPAQEFDNYGYTAPTIADSNHIGMFTSNFLVVAHTNDDDVFFVSEPMSGYSVDNIAPADPSNVSFQTFTYTTTLSWDAPLDEDYAYTEVRRNGEVLASGSSFNQFVDESLAPGESYSYDIVHIDENGNESRNETRDMTAPEWYFQLTTQAEGTGNSIFYFAGNDEASMGYDPGYDLPAPPPAPNQGVRMVSHNPSWGNILGDDYSYISIGNVDFMNFNRSVELEVHSDINGTVPVEVLPFGNLSAVENFAVYVNGELMTDQMNGIYGGTFEMPVSNSTITYVTLVVGNPEGSDGFISVDGLEEISIFPGDTTLQLNVAYTSEVDRYNLVYNLSHGNEFPIIENIESDISGYDTLELDLNDVLLLVQASHIENITFSVVALNESGGDIDVDRTAQATVIGDTVGLSMPQPGWSLVNPYYSGDIIDDVITGDFNGAHVAYDWNHDYQTYEIINNTDKVAQGGKAFWLGNESENEIVFFGGDYPDLYDENVNTEGRMYIEYNARSGWIMAGAGARPVHKDSIIIHLNEIGGESQQYLWAEASSMGLIQNEILLYNRFANGYYTLNTPTNIVTGFWIGVVASSYAGTHTIGFEFPRHFIHPTGGREANDLAYDWGFTLNNLIFGFSDLASDGYDGFDIVSPPIPPIYGVYMRINNEEWESPLGDSYLSDIRNSIGDDNMAEYSVKFVGTGDYEISTELYDLPDSLVVTLHLGDELYDLTSNPLVTISVVNGQTGTVSVAPAGTLSNDMDATIPQIFALHQNYPNPFNPITQIRYDLPQSEFVSVIIFDVMGRKIKSLINTNQEAGYRSVKWDATNNLGQPVSAGMYIYTIQAGEFRQTRKMVLLK